ncbi:hypothetical protein [uncultured Thiodictyon sp.]|uniref:hypothetical protein n=1 Tax=uncultured Thiodictyon sp. TaxID=1846217 RepID=UPI0025D49BC1|nr:hypothetical protein [uncultured Thiodictyon sp.]
MTIETDLTRIAEALERLVALGEVATARPLAGMTTGTPSAATTTVTPPAHAAATPQTSRADTEAAPEAQQTAAPEPEPADKITLEVLRAKFRDLSSRGKRDQLMAIIAAYGVDRLPLIAEQHYPAVMRSAAALEAA